MYTNIGYCAHTDIRRLASAYLQLTSYAKSQPLLRTKVAELFTAAQIDPVKTKHYTFTAARVMSLAGAASDKRGLALYTFIHSLLNICGRAGELPPSLYTREDPSLSIGEATWLVALSYADTTKFKTYLPPSTTPIMSNDIADAVYYMLMDFDRWQAMMPTLEPRMLSLVEHIKWKIKMSQPIDQFEKTLWLHAASVVYGREQVMRSPRTNITLAEKAVPKENADPLVSMFADKLKTVTLPGPKFSFIPLLSNMAPEALFATYGPFPAKAVVAAGWFADFAPYTAMSLKPMIAPVTLTPEEHLLGLMSTSTWGKASTLNKLALGLQESSTLENLIRWNFHRASVWREGIQTGAMEKMLLPIIVDIPEVDLVWHNNTVFYRYQSEVFGRPVLTQSTDGILYELAKKTRQYGGTASYRSSIDEYPIADISDVIRTSVSQLQTLKLRVVYTNFEGNVRDDREVDMRPFFAQYGDKIVRPAFTRYFKPPVSMLEAPQAAAVGYIAQRLGLAEYEILMSSRALTICYNAFVLMKIFDTVPQIGSKITPEDSDIVAFAKTALYKKG